MSVRCPSCQHSIALKGAKPGRYTPKCPSCQQRFLLIISIDDDAEPIVEALPNIGGSVAGVTAVGQATAASATMPPPAANVTVGGSAQTMAPPPDVTIPKHTVHPNVTLPKPTLSGEAIGLGGSAGDLPGRSAGETYAPSGPTLSGTLGGYEILEKLGEGGMGAVYLARQVSLDRNVALKILAPQLAADPQFVARFTREAYAAAQLSHHNVVQIHDIGVDRDVNYFSMELVPGQTLEKLVKSDGKLDPEVAIGYVLQAARGLRFAHEHGLIHRDVKPDNLLLNEQGIVKVADLGLVKQAGKGDELTNAGAALAAPSSSPSSIALGKTQFNISMGTPAYMPPEQARDAAHVDHRADIYSLGCTLYDLLTGRPPFHGKTAFEVITKHQTEPIVPPDRVARHVSPELSSVVMKMMAKRPEERYPSMADVVEALEALLGVESGKPFSPKEEHVRVLESSVEAFNGSKWAKLRKNLVLGFYGMCAAGAVLLPLLLSNGAWLAGGLIGFALLTTLFYQAILGITQKTHLFTRVRQYVFGARLTDWLMFLSGSIVLVLLLIAFGLHWIWLGAAIGAGLVAAAFHFTIDQLAARERATPVGYVEGMLKKMRLRGLDETALRQFVCKYAGERWEELYEALFGYEAKRSARRSWGKSERGRNRKKFGAWRDVIIDWIDRRTIARREERERKLLAKLEAKALAAKGMDQASANRKAKESAARMVDKASQVKAAADRRMMQTAVPTKTSSGRTIMFGDQKSLTSWATGFESEASHDKKHDGERVHESYFKRRFGTPLDFILGPQVRILAGAILICLFALWFKQSGVQISVDGKGLATVSDAVETAKGRVDRGIDVKSNVKVSTAKPWSLPGVPDVVCNTVGTFNAGIAGLLLLISGFFSGKPLGLAVLLGAAVTLLLYRFDLPLVADRRWIAAGIGAGIGLLGILFFRKTAADA